MRGKQTVVINGKNNDGGNQLVVGGPSTSGSVANIGSIATIGGIGNLNSIGSVATISSTPGTTSLNNIRTLTSSSTQHPTSTLILTSNAATGSNLQPISGTTTTAATLPSSNIILPNVSTAPTAIVLTNSVTGISSILSLQQYQSLIQQQYQQHQQPSITVTQPLQSQQRLLTTPPPSTPIQLQVQRATTPHPQISGSGSVTLTLGNFITNANIASNSSVSSNTNHSSNSNLIINNCLNTTPSIINGYQQQFQRHLLSNNVQGTVQTQQQSVVTVVNLTNCNNSNGPITNQILSNQLATASTSAARGGVASNISGVGVVSSVGSVGGVATTSTPSESYILVNRQVSKPIAKKVAKRNSNSNLQSVNNQVINGSNKNKGNSNSTLNVNAIKLPNTVVANIGASTNISDVSAAGGSVLGAAGAPTAMSSTQYTISSTASAIRTSATVAGTAIVTAISPMVAQQIKQPILANTLAATTTNQLLQQRATTIVLGNRIRLAATDVRKNMITATTAATTIISTNAHNTMSNQIISSTTQSKIAKIITKKAFTSIFNPIKPIATALTTTAAAGTSILSGGIQIMQGVTLSTPATVALTTLTPGNIPNNIITTSSLGLGVLGKQLQGNTATINGPITTSIFTSLNTSTSKAIISNGHTKATIACITPSQQQRQPQSQPKLTLTSNMPVTSSVGAALIPQTITLTQAKVSNMNSVITMATKIQSDVVDAITKKEEISSKHVGNDTHGVVNTPSGTNELSSLNTKNMAITSLETVMTNVLSDNNSTDKGIDNSSNNYTISKIATNNTKNSSNNNITDNTEISGVKNNSNNEITFSTTGIDALINCDSSSVIYKENNANAKSIPLTLNINDNDTSLNSVKSISPIEEKVSLTSDGSSEVNDLTNSTNNNDLQENSLTLGSDCGNIDEQAKECEEPEVDIVINNVVCSFSVRCHLNLREIALRGSNVEYRRENGMVTMKLRRPYTTASIWSSGRITCTGATSEGQAKVAARRYARCLQKLGFNVRFHNFRVVNVLGTCSMPWGIKIVAFSECYKRQACYEPELHPGVTYKLDTPKATLKIFSTGSITVTASSVASVQTAIEHIYTLVYEFRKPRSTEESQQCQMKQQLQQRLAELQEQEIIEKATIKAAANNGKKPRSRTQSQCKLKPKSDGVQPPKKKRCVARVEKSDIPVEFDDMEEEAKRLLMNPYSTNNSPVTDEIDIDNDLMELKNIYEKI